MFGIEAALNILDLKLENKHWPVMKPFLIFLNYIRSNENPEPMINMEKKKDPPMTADARASEL